MPARLAAAWFGAWMTLLAVGFTVAPPGVQLALCLIGGLSAVIAVGAGVRRHEFSGRLPWRLLGVAVVLSAAGTALLRASSAVLARLPLLEGVGAVCTAAAYPVVALVLLIFVRRRTGGLRDRAGLLDGLTVISGVALLAWTFLLGPHLAQWPPSEGWPALAYPVGDLLCLGMLIRLLTASGRKPAAAGVLGAGLAVLLAADVGHQLSLFDVEIAGQGRFAFYAAAGLAALHPSMIDLTRPAGAPPADVSRGRLVLIGIASMVAPAVLLAKMFSDGEVPDLTVVAVLSALTFVLVLVRMAGIVGSHRLALARERALREASAVLVSAADPEAISAAVRTAVAQLLPADTPHGVVLARTIAPEDPPSPEAVAQAAVDRSTGTAARMVATREVDWAVAVRLTHFNMTLRCPMVLEDRPNGDPLVGVLHVGAPNWALPGLQRAIEVLAGQAALALERVGLNQEVIRRNSETYFRTLVQNTADVILIVDELNRIRYASPSAVPVLGADPTGVRLPEVIHPGDRARLADVLATVRGGGDIGHDGLDFRGAGEVLLEVHCRDLRAERTVAGLVITMRDVTERRRLERELTHQAFHDSLTGLANRVLFADRLQHALARAARDGSVVGVLFIDLDDFKIVNDTLGHAVGDQLLISVADRIAGALRADDTAARLGGDEFAALIENVWDADAVEETAQRIIDALGAPVHIDDQTLYAVASVGITTTPEASTAEELLRQADLALYVAKGAGKNQWRRYQAHLHGAMVERLELRTALDHAVNEGRFLLAYQPIVDLTTDEPVGFEALVRWHHPTKGVIAPAEFIEVAEESGLIVPMGRWVLDQALHTVAQWRRILPRTRQPYVSVNVSVRQFREAGFVEQIMQALAYAGVPPHALMLEITETLLVGDDERIWHDLAVLRDHGVRIAIDDFGTGYSSLGYLRQRPIDAVKIDKMFIDDMIGSQQQLALVAGIVSLAQSLDLTVIAEGIESWTHRDLLARMGCPLGQGYLYSSPVDGTEALSQMTDREPLVA